MSLTRTLQTNPVTLNLFQGPSGRQDRSERYARNLTKGWRGLSNERTGWAEKWTLKQVQGDELGRGSVIL
jgi:hypothetical protein